MATECNKTAGHPAYQVVRTVKKTNVSRNMSDLFLSELMWPAIDGYVP
jgi:hypothetical protein